MTSVELREIVAAAATLTERLSDRFALVDVPNREELVNARLSRWCQTAAQGDWGHFRARLAAEELDEEQVRVVLGPMRLKDDAPLPQWAHMLAECLNGDLYDSLDFHDGYESSPLALSDNHADQNHHENRGSNIFIPFVATAWQCLTRRAGRLLELLTESVRSDLQGYLQHRLSEAACPTLLAIHDIQSLSQMTVKDGIEIWGQYPVLARLLSTLTDFWVEANIQLLKRTQADYEALGAAFCPNQKLGQIAALAIGLAEPHQHGQTVMKLTFANGLTVYYKPRNLDFEVAWFELLRQINQTGISLPFVVLRVLSRNGYGWMEAAAPSPCQDPTQVARFYRRAGMLLYLLYLFTGSDFQQENVIACGEQPVLIDLETLMTPAMHGQEQRLVPQRTSETVFRTHFLPHWKDGSDHKFRAVGGMDAIRVAANITVTSEQKAAEVTTGFREMSQWLNSHHELLPALLSQFEGLPLRVIFQDTQVYQRLIQRSLQPRLLKDGCEREIELECLARVACPPQQYIWHVPRIRQELGMLAQLDIPYFTTRTDTTDLSCPSGLIISDYFAEPCCQTIRRNFARFEATDRECQLRLIQHAFDVKAAVESPFQSKESRVPSGEVKTDVLFDETAIELAELLKTMAVQTRNEAVIWMIPGEIVTADELVYQFRQCDHFLYQGSLGIALFLAALETIRSEAGYGDLAYAATRSLHIWLKQPWIPPKIGIGTANGLGSLVYALTWIGMFLEEPQFIEEARQAATLITPERIAADRRLDIFDGAAGALLALLVLYAATHDRTALDQAILCGEHLLSRRTERVPRAWQTIRTTPVSGFSHGVAGIAYALLRLFAITGQELFQQAAQEGIAFEDRLFSSIASNWRAFASSLEHPKFWTTYCHGAPGIGLARIGGLDVLDTPDIRADIMAALHTTSAFPLDGLDFLCCGNFGRIETLLTAGMHLHQPENIERVQQQAASLIARQTASGGFRTFEDLPPRVINPGFFRGIAGIGYQLLRLASPDQFPSVLLWE